MFRSFIIVLVLIISSSCLAEIPDPEVWEGSQSATINTEQVPEEIKDIVAEPPIIKEPLKLPSKKSVWEAGLKATVFPGWGHFYLEQYNRAWVISGVELALLIGIINSDPTKYENASEATRDTIYQQRETLSVLGGLIWLWSVFDTVSLTIENNRQIEEEERKISFEYNNGLRLSYRYRWN